MPSPRTSSPAFLAAWLAETIGSHCAAMGRERGAMMSLHIARTLLGMGDDLDTLARVEDAWDKIVGVALNANQSDAARCARIRRLLLPSSPASIS